MKRTFLLILFLALSLTAPFLFKKMTRGFRLAKLELSDSFPFPPSQPLTADLVSIFSQKFYYLSRGCQSYVFGSEDGQWVLKLFRFDRFKRSKGGRAKKLQTFANSCLFAYEEAQEETALTFLHLDITENTCPHVQMIGPLRRGYRIDLNRYRFALQRRGVLFREAFLKAYREKREDLAREYLLALFKLLEKKEGFSLQSTDPSFERNFAFLDGKAIEIDFGSYEQRQSPDLFSDFSQKVKQWFKKEMPDWVFLVDEAFSSSDPSR